ncbi:MAG TPA: hypothetical protein VGK31_14825 [Thermoanaerobaculia bacterium]
MIKSRSAVAALLFIALAPSVHAVCTLNLRLADPSTLTWDVIPGLTTYQVQESFDNYATSRNYFTKTPPFHINHRASADTKIWYLVTAALDSRTLAVNPFEEGCTETLVVTLKADPEFRALTRKAVLPIVGSGPGAFGGRFKTSLKLSPSGPVSGRLVFHPSGSTASPDDPSMPYNIDSISPIIIDDIVAELGRTGIGSLDIVPDTNAVPVVEARFYNDTPNGTFGTATAAFYPFDYLQAPTLNLTIPDTRFRINIGLRTLTETKAKALVYNIYGKLREFRDLAWPADYTILGTVRQVLGVDLQPGESVSLFFEGAAIPFYTRTENRTNDPELFVVTPAHSTNVNSYVE